MEEKFLGKIINFDPYSQVLTIKCDFLDLEKQKVLENLCNDMKLFSFCFNKPYRRNKTYPQLKKYYRLLTLVLKAFEIFPDADTISAFDTEIKKQALSCKTMVIRDSELPLIPSKADMSVEELSFLIQYVVNHYGEIIEGEYNEE